MNDLELNYMTKEGPNITNEVKIIAVEFAMRFPQLAGQEVELEMFPCSHTIRLDHMFYGYSHQVRFTLHTSRGDKTIQQPVQF